MFASMYVYLVQTQFCPCYNRCKRRREQQHNCSVKCTPSSFNNSQDEDRRTLSHQLNPLTAETASNDVSRSDHETPGPSVNEQPIANYSTTETVSEDVSMDEMASHIVDEVHFPTLTEVNPATVCAKQLIFTRTV